MLSFCSLLLPLIPASVAQNRINKIHVRAAKWWLIIRNTIQANILNCRNDVRLSERVLPVVWLSGASVAISTPVPSFYRTLSLCACATSLTPATLCVSFAKPGAIDFWPEWKSPVISCDLFARYILQRRYFGLKPFKRVVQFLWASSTIVSFDCILCASSMCNLVASLKIGDFQWNNILCSGKKNEKKFI